MAILQSCCCLNNVRSGSLASGIYTLILSLLNTALSAYNLHEQVKLESNDNQIPPSLKVASYGWFVTTLVQYVLLFICSVLLIVGIHKDNRHYLVPWLGVTTAMIIVDTVVLIYQCVMFGLLTFNIILMVIWLGLTLLNIYCILCVISQYQELKAGRGTIEAIQRQRAMLIYQTGIQQVHITQGPIVMVSPGSITSSVHNSAGQPNVTATVVMTPGGSYPPTTPASPLIQTTSTEAGPIVKEAVGQQAPLLRMDEPPPPYSPQRSSTFGQQGQTSPV